MAKIYLSSTYSDLKDYRELVCQTLRQMRHEVIAMEDYIATDRRSLEKCLTDVGNCELYIGIVAWRYGHIPEADQAAGKSITELEFRHAVSERKPCLIFLLAEDHPWPPIHMEKGNGNSQLQAFRSDLMANYTVSMFGSKENLARLVSSAVYNWEFRRSAPQPQSTRQDRMGPNLGNLVFKTCNRNRQVSEFRSFFTTHLRQSPGSPQIYFISGKENECHDSLVERLVHTQIQPVSEKQWGKQYGVVTVKKLGWVYDGELPVIQQDLQRGLFEKFDSYMEEDLSAVALRNLASTSLNQMIVIHHTIRLARWDTQLKESLRWYLTYWASINHRSANPQFLLFLSLVYPDDKSGFRWKEWLAFNRFNKQVIERELQDILLSLQDGCPCLRLSELLPVRREDVKDWLSFNDIDTEKQRYEFLNRIFETARGKNIEFKSMAEVEHELQIVLKSAQRSYIRGRIYHD